MFRNGKIFDRDEVIVEVNDNSMSTIRNEEIFSCGKWTDIRMFYYDLDKNKEQVAVSENGYTEIMKDDKDYSQYKGMLERAGLWEEKL